VDDRASHYGPSHSGASPSPVRVDSCGTECLPTDSERGVEQSAEDRPPSPDLSFSPRPFVWQHERRLLLLDKDGSYWILAELRFEPAVCRYTEIRRASYRWEREAVGALLSRALASGMEAAANSAAKLNEWAKTHRYVQSLV
jgi:hypothetical protein